MKIGFIDYYLDEWHANNYPAWIRDASRKAGLDFEITYAWAETDRPGGLNTADWCRKFGIGQLAALDDLVDRSDCLLVLSPDNPERHEDLARLALLSGKPVYIDKTFAPGLAAGQRLFDLAEQHQTPLFSSSALRFAQELAAWPNGQVNPATLEFVATLGPGQYSNYAVHQLEMIVALLGPGARRIKSLSTGHARTLTLDFADGRRARMTQMANLPFQLALQLAGGESFFIGQCSDYFPRLIDAILRFFQTGCAPVPRAETLSIMALIEAGQQALTAEDTWIAVPE